ncbi:AfsR/SARP family transcriptional regulator [Saccharothrix syringae]|nr:BTAD domain-containing putative transcriptional regulator [Saccharothrix syringae]
MATAFKVLGPLEVWHDDRPVPLPAGKARVLLAVLLLRANRVVPVDELVDVLWPGASAPERSRAGLHMVVTRLRRSLGEVDVVRTATNGYLADVPDGTLDLECFRRFAATGRFAEALDLWRGAPLSDVRSDALHAEEVAPLLEERLAVLEQRVDADLAAGRAAELVPELRALTGEHPLRERFWAQLMTALTRSGRQSEALAAYQALSAHLVEELGVDPSPRLRELHQRILTNAPDPAAGGAPVPRQLPLHTPFFIGRDRELAALADLLDPGGPAGGAVVISAISGAPGIGKTALALHWAARNRQRFPDGQLYVNLRGFDPAAVPVPPDVAVRGFLGALGVPRERVPPTADEQVALYRSLLADRRVLVVLDNAADSEQVRPLLPSGPACLAVVTSRRRLDGLVVREGARSLAVDVLDDVESTALLAHQLGADRVAAEPGAVRDLVRHCAGLPLALSVVAARAATHPEFPLRVFADELADERTRLAALDTGDTTTSVRAVFSWSYERLSPAAARLFGLLGWHPGPEVSVAAAASLAGVEPREARTTLAELRRVNLVVEHAPGRFSQHDLVCAYARELVSAEAVRPGLARMFDHYLHSADAADRVLYPHRDEIALPPPEPGAAVRGFASRAEAMAWFQLEYPVLCALVSWAHETGFHRHAWQVPWATTAFARLRGHWHEQAGCQLVALEAARLLDDPVGVMSAHRGLGRMNIMLRRLDVAEHHLRIALDLARELGDRRVRANIHRHLGGLYEFADRAVEALHHTEQAFELFRELGDRAGCARSLNAIGWNRATVGDHRRALADCERALELFQQLNDVLGEAATWDSLGYVHHHLGDLDEAVRCYRAALPLYRVSGDRFEEAATLERLGDTHEVLGDRAEARRTWADALAILEDIGHSAVERVRGKLAAAP